MAGAEGVVDVAIGQGGHLPGEAQVTLFLAAVKPHVLEHDDAAREQRMAGGLARGPTVSSTFMTGRPMSSAAARPRGPSGTAGPRPGRPRAAQVTDQDQASATIQDIVGAWEGRFGCGDRRRRFRRAIAAR